MPRRIMGPLERKAVRQEEDARAREKTLGSINDPYVVKALAAQALVRTMSKKPTNKVGDTRSLPAKTADDWMKYE